MNNKRLNRFSDQYISDNRDKVEQRCFFLFAGSDLNEGQAFKLDLALYVNDDLNASKFAKVEIVVDNLTVEQCSDVIVSLTHLVPDFKTVLRYDDLFFKPIGKDLEKRVRF
jgi:hypothetical protein